MGEWVGRWPTLVWTLVCVCWLVVVWTWSSLHLAMTVDDTYYYLKTALNLSHGHGSSFDGINPTDGYHPLWLAILAVVFKPLGDDVVFLTRVAFTLQIVMVWGGGLLLARLREVGGPKLLWPLALVIVNPLAAKIVLCGQETALQFLLSSAALATWWSLRESRQGIRASQWIGVALMCTLAALARLDNVFFCGALLAMPLVLPSEREQRAGLAARLKLTALGMIVFGCGLGAFLAFHYATFHHLMPVSGAIKQHLDSSEVASGAARVAAVVISLAGIFCVWRAARRRSSRVLALLAPPITGALVVALYNFGVRGEMSPRLIRIWYLEPYLFAGVLATGALLTQSRRFVVLAVCASVAWFGLAVVAWRYRVQPRSYSIYQAAERCSRWAEEYDVGAVGAAWDAGFAGAFTRKPVMNLDGLISSWEYKEQYFDRGKVDEFISTRQRVDFVIQYAYSTTVNAIARRFEHEPLPPIPRPQTSVIGSHDPRALSGRWGVDLAAFYVAHVECVPVSVTTDPMETFAVYYFVLTRAPITNHTTLAEFAIDNRTRSSCDGFAGP